MTMREQDRYSGQTGQRDTVELAQNKVGDVKEQIQAQASHLVDKAQERAQSQIAMQKEKAVSTLGSVAGALRQTSQTLRDQEQAPFAQVADKAAEQLDNLTSYLQNHEPREMMMEVERFARRQPALFLGGAFVLGLLGARFLKSSAESQQREMYARQYGQYGGQPNYGGGNYGGQPNYGSQYGGSFGGQYGYSSQFGGNFGEQQSGQYGGQYTNQYGGQYGGEQYTGYPRTYENESSFQSGSSLQSGGSLGTSSDRSATSSDDMLFGRESEER